MCLPAASVLPIANNENFGTFSFHGSFPTSGATYLWGNVPRSGTTRQRCETSILHPILGSSLPRFVAVAQVRSWPTPELCCTAIESPLSGLLRSLFFSHRVLRVMTLGVVSPTPIIACPSALVLGT
jgi:hypothetical protein